LEVIQEAVYLQQQLAAEHPSTFNVPLQRSLENLSEMLFILGF
jgi:hypothetical protein